MKSHHTENQFSLGSPDLVLHAYMPFTQSIVVLGFNMFNQMLKCLDELRFCRKNITCPFLTQTHLNISDSTTTMSHH